MPFQRRNGLFPCAVEHVLPAKVVHSPIIVGRFLHRELQQRQILPAGFAGVGMMIQLHSRDNNAPLLQGRVRRQHLMHGMHPAISMPGVDLIGVKYVPFAAVREKIPGVAIGGAGRARLPRGFQQCPPAGVKHLVQIGADANVRILRHQRQRAVPCGIKAPRVDALHRDLCPNAVSFATVSSVEPVSST